MTDVADKLREAKALIERGWCQKAFTSYSRQSPGQVCYCLYGAINQAALGVPDADSVVTLPYEELLGKVLGREPEELAPWNDAEERTQAEVLAAFDKAIELAEASQ